MNQCQIKLLTVKIANIIKKSEIPLLYGSDIEKIIGSDHKDTIRYIYIYLFVYNLLNFKTNI